MRPDIWREEKNKPNLGPCYENMKSSFDQTSKKGPMLRGKQSTTIKDTPGPGQYDNQNLISMTKK